MYTFLPDFYNRFQIRGMELAVKNLEVKQTCDWANFLIFLDLLCDVIFPHCRPISEYKRAKAPFFLICDLYSCSAFVMCAPMLKKPADDGFVTDDT